MVASFAGFRAAGATVKEIPAPPAAPRRAFPGDRGYEGWARWVDAHPESEYDDAVQIIDVAETARLLAPAASYTGTGRMTATEVAGWKAFRAEYKARLARWMDDNGVDAVVYPGLLSDISLNDTVIPSFARIDPQSSASGVPSVIFPAGKNDHDEPFNLQLMGRAWDDAKLMGYAYAYDQVQHGHQETTRGAAAEIRPERHAETDRDRGAGAVDDDAARRLTRARTLPTPPAARRVAIKVGAREAGDASSGGKVRFLLRNGSSARLTGHRHAAGEGRQEDDRARHGQGRARRRQARDARRDADESGQKSARQTREGDRDGDLRAQKRDRREGDEKGGADDRAEVGPAHGIGSAAE